MRIGRMQPIARRNWAARFRKQKRRTQMPRRRRNAKPAAFYVPGSSGLINVCRADYSPPITSANPKKTLILGIRTAAQVWWRRRPAGGFAPRNARQKPPARRRRHQSIARWYWTPRGARTPQNCYP
jgi:hypothetical protein